MSTTGRVSTSGRYDSTIATLQQRQAAMSKAQLQLSSGKRISQPSDDPTGAARAERALIAQSRIDSEQRSIDVSSSAMKLAEAALGDAGDLMQSARETLVNAGNGSYTATERDALATKLQQIRTQLLSVANQTDGVGGYVFGGQGAQSQPFIDGVGGVSFVGTAGEGQLSNREQVPVTLDGSSIWMQESGGVNVFQSLDQAIAVLQDPASTDAVVSQAVVDGMSQLDGLMSGFQSARSIAGTAMNRLDSMSLRNEDRKLWAKTVQSDVEDLDMVEGISNFQNEQTSYQAALQTYSLVQGMSLFDYIK